MSIDSWAPPNRRHQKMGKSAASSRGRRGRISALSYIEVLVASAVCVLSLSVMIQLWSVSMNIQVRSADLAAAYNLERQTLEQVVESGFTDTVEAPSYAPSVHYYDGNQNLMDTSPATARYKVATTVVSSALVSGSNPPVPTTSALRLVTVAVTLVPTKAALCQVSAYLTRGGV